jgi:S-methylmethionine-dependent homocysteine/selenocysteine methylase
LIEVLAAEGCDLMLVETFPLAREAWTAVEEAVHTGLETWASFTAGPHGDLLTPEDLRSAALGAVERGAGAVLVNCVAATKVGPYVDALAGLGVPVGAYANAGKIDEAVGWRRDTTLDTNLYETLARGWAERGATILGGCCGTGPQHIAALSQALT